MKLTAISKIKNGLLWDAVKVVGSQVALANHLGIRPGTLGEWLSLKDVPNLSRCRKWHPEKWQAIEDKLIALTGGFLEDIFPQELLGSDFLAQPKTHENSIDVPMERLLDAPREFLQLPPVQEEICMQDERDRDIEAALATLTPREEKILRMRFGFDGEEKTLNEAGQACAISPERTRQIEAKAIRKLRYPRISRLLIDHAR
jgi:RNA polymerase sigma factor (sigma-70 family)